MSRMTAKTVRKTLFPILYFKGLVVEDMNNTRKIGAIAIAFLNTRNQVEFQDSKPLLLPDNELSAEVAQLEAFDYALKFALSFNRTRVCYHSDDFDLDSLLKEETRKQIQHFLLRLIPGCFMMNASRTPEEIKITALLKSVTNLKKRFQACNPSYLATKKNAELVTELARSSIAKQAAGKQDDDRDLINKENCVICLEDVDSKLIHELDGCKHRFCWNCLQQYVVLRVTNKMLPRCPVFTCGLEMSLDACRKFVTPELYDTVEQIIKESSIPVTDKVYCPSPKCSYLMRRTEALADSKSDRSPMLTTGSCVKCDMMFCVNCKAPCHSGLSCYAYKSHEWYSGSVDASLKLLAHERGWQQCPMCSHMVERNLGCSVIKCRCGHNFCYSCGRPAKCCTCGILPYLMNHPRLAKVQI